MGLKTDYSFLFDSLNGKSNSSDFFKSVNLSEYNNIKSGVYKKVLNAYYDKQVSTKSDKKTDKKTDKKDTVQDKAVKKLTEVAKDASELQTSAEKLIKVGSKSVFNKEDGEYNTEKIYDAVKDFTAKYNDVLSSMSKSENDDIEKQVSDVTKLVVEYKEELKSIGITINEKDNSLQLNEEAFKSADMDAVKKLFNGNSSMAYVISSRASNVGMDANSEMNAMKNYTNTGNYSDSLNIGNLLNDII